MHLSPGVTLKYCPPVPLRTLIQLADAESTLELDGASLHSTTTGLQLTTGTLEVKGKCFLTSDATSKAEGIIFGDGISEVNDLTLQIKPESNLKLTSGHLVYKNLT